MMLLDPSVSPTPTTTTVASTTSLSTPYRICLIGTAVDDPKTVEAARSFGVPVITSETGEEFLTDTSWLTYFIMNDFEGPLFEAIQATGHRWVSWHWVLIEFTQLIGVDLFRILGPPALQHHMTAKEGLIHKKRPIYNYSMKGVITCFTGIRNKGELVSII